jgi:hypothetical protein
MVSCGTTHPAMVPIVSNFPLLLKIIQISFQLVRTGCSQMPCSSKSEKIQKSHHWFQNYRGVSFVLLTSVYFRVYLCIEKRACVDWSKDGHQQLLDILCKVWASLVFMNSSNTSIVTYLEK